MTTLTEITLLVDAMVENGPPRNGAAIEQALGLETADAKFITTTIVDAAIEVADDTTPDGCYRAFLQVFQHAVLYGVAGERLRVAAADIEALS